MDKLNMHTYYGFKDVMVGTGGKHLVFTRPYTFSGLGSFTISYESCSDTFAVYQGETLIGLAEHPTTDLGNRHHIETLARQMISAKVKELWDDHFSSAERQEEEKDEVPGQSSSIFSPEVEEWALSHGPCVFRTFEGFLFFYQELGVDHEVPTMRTEDLVHDGEWHRILDWVQIGCTRGRGWYRYVPELDEEVEINESYIPF